MLCHMFLGKWYTLGGVIAIYVADVVAILCVVDVVTTRQMVQPVVEQGSRCYCHCMWQMLSKLIMHVAIVMWQMLLPRWLMD